MYIMFDQKSQDIAVPDGVVKILLSQEKLTLSDCFLGIFRVDSSKRAKETCAQSGGEHSACQVKNRADFFFFFFTVLCFHNGLSGRATLSSVNALAYSSGYLFVSNVSSTFKK